MTSTKPKLKLIIKSPRRFLINKENQQLQQKIFDTLAEWTTWKLVDELYLSLMSVREDDNRRRKYEEQARKNMYWMVFPPHTAFVINLRDLDGKVKRELAKRHKELRDLVLRQAVEKIFEVVDESYFLLSAKQYLKVRLES